MSARQPMQPRMVRMPDDLYAEVQRLAEQDDRSVSWMIRRAVREYTQRSAVRTRRST